MQNQKHDHGEKNYAKISSFSDKVHKKTSLTLKKGGKDEKFSMQREKRDVYFKPQTDRGKLPNLRSITTHFERINLVSIYNIYTSLA
jgi:hypothetical protein